MKRKILFFKEYNIRCYLNKKVRMYMIYYYYNSELYMVCVGVYAVIIGFELGGGGPER